MTIRLTALLLVCCVVTFGPPAPARAQAVGDVFRQVSPSVVVIRTRGRDVAASGLVRFGEIGSRVLISADGKVMTAAHVVHSMDEITVEFIGGEAVGARVVASEPARRYVAVPARSRARGGEGRPPRRLGLGPGGRPRDGRGRAVLGWRTR